MDGDETPFVEALLAAPAGVALLARLEAEHRSDVAWFDSPADSDPAVVGQAARSVGTMSFGRMVKLAVEAAESLAGPWTGDAPGPLVGAYRHAAARRPIAEAVDGGLAAELLAVPGQHAMRAHVSRHVLPDWAAVSADYDGVHLSWAGFLTTEGYVCDLDAGGVTMLRYWGSERTHWLADVFGDPVPLGAPVLSGSMSGALGVDVGVDDARRAHDLDVLTKLLVR